MLNNQMDDFSLAPGTPNAFGLVGSYANAIAPGKRPLSSMSPSIVLDADRLPAVTCGAAGGPRIITATLQVLLRVLDLKQAIKDAISGCRVHHQWSPDTLLAEKANPTTNGVSTERERGNNDPYAITQETMDGLQSLGHTVRPAEALAIAQGIQRDGDRLRAAHDPRAQGSSGD